MNRLKCLLFLLFPVLICSCNQNNGEGYVIKGKIDNMPDGHIYLMERVNKVYYVNSETTVVNGEFTFEGSVVEPGPMFLAVEDSTRFFQFFIENKKMTIYGNKDVPQDIKIKGSKLNDLYLGYRRDLMSLEAKERVLYDEYSKHDVESEEKQLLEEKIAEVEKGYKNLVDSFVYENPESIISPNLILSQLYYYTLEELETLYSVLKGDAQNNEYYRDLQTVIESMKNISVGSKYVDFEMEDVNGNMVKLSDKVGKGYLLVDFWASWCFYCRVENPNLVNLYNRYHDQGFDILGVSLDDSRASWLEAIEKDSLTWTHVSDLSRWSNEAAKLYVVRAIPSNVLISPDGIVVAKNLVGNKLTTKLEEIYK